MKIKKMSLRIYLHKDTNIDIIENNDDKANNKMSNKCN